MTVKEQPLINAVSKVEALPRFVFSNPVFTGVIAMWMCATFGGTAAFMVAAGHGAAYAAELFDIARLGAVIAMALSAFFLLGQGGYTVLKGDEVKARLLFVLGGYLGIALMVLIDWLAYDILRGWLKNMGSIVYTG